MLFNVIGCDNQVMGQVEADSQIEAWEKAGKEFNNILDIRLSNGEKVTRGLPKREYSMGKIAEMAQIFYEITARRTATVYIPTGPVYTRWADLSQPEKDRATYGLKERIEREGLRGYLERKRPMAGDTLTNEIILELETKGFL